MQAYCFRFYFLYVTVIISSEMVADGGLPVFHSTQIVDRELLHGVNFLVCKPPVETGVHLRIIDGGQCEALTLVYAESAYPKA